MTFYYLYKLDFEEYKLILFGLSLTLHSFSGHFHYIAALFDSSCMLIDSGIILLRSLCSLSIMGCSGRPHSVSGLIILRSMGCQVGFCSFLKIKICTLLVFSHRSVLDQVDFKPVKTCNGKPSQHCLQVPVSPLKLDPDTP